MAYYILTEPESSRIKRQVLMRSVVKSRRKNIRKSAEYINDDPEMESFTLSLQQHQQNIMDLVKYTAWYEKSREIVDNLTRRNLD